MILPSFQKLWHSFSIKLYPFYNSPQIFNKHFIAYKKKSFAGSKQWVISTFTFNPWAKNRVRHCTYHKIYIEPCIWKTNVSLSSWNHKLSVQIIFFHLNVAIFLQHSTGSEIVCVLKTTFSYMPRGFPVLVVLHLKKITFVKYKEIFFSRQSLMFFEHFCKILWKSD